MAELHTGNGQGQATATLLREVLAELAKEKGLLLAPAVRDIGADDGDPQWFTSSASFLNEPRKPIEYLLEPFIYSRSFTVISGPPKAGKTWFLCWLATECAAKGKRVFFVEQEGPRELLREMLRPFVGPDVEVYRDRLFIAHRSPLQLDAAKSVDALISQIKRCDLLILDPLVMLHTRSENKTEEMALLVNAVMRIIGRLSCSIVLVQHPRKGESYDKRSKAESDSVEVRGSTALVAGADSIISLKSVAEEDRRRGEIRFYLSNPDTRLGAPFERKLVSFKIDDGAATAQFLVPDGGAQKAKAPEYLAKILPFIPAAPGQVSVNLLADKAEIRKASVSLAVELGIERGTIKRVGKGASQGVSRA